MVWFGPRRPPRRIFPRRATLCGALLPALCLLAGSVALAGPGSSSSKAHVYRWVDEKGEVHFGDHLPSTGTGKPKDGAARPANAAPAANPAPAAKAAPDAKDPKDAKAADAPAKK